MIIAMLRKLIVFVTVAFGLLTGVSAEEGIWLRHFDTKGYEIRTAYRDAGGIMWLGTSSGLVSLPQLMSRDPNAYQRQFAELNSAIDFICGDSLGRLTMKTQNRDVIMYDPRHHQYEFDTAAMLEQEGIHISKDFSMQVDGSSRRWLWKDNVIWLPKTGSDKGEPQTRHFNQEQIEGVWPMAQQAAVVTEKALYYIATSSGKTIRRVEMPADIKDFMTIYAVNDAELWIRSGRSLKMYDFAKNQWTTDITLPSEITGFQIAGDGRRWVSTMNDGIFIYNEQGVLLQHLLHDIRNTGGLKSNRIITILYEQESGLMWIAYWKGGLSVCNTRQQDGRLWQIGSMADQDAGTDVLTFCQSAGGKKIYAGTEDRGVFVSDTPGHWSNIVNSSSITALYTDTDGTLWTGLYRKGLMARTSDGREILYFKGSSPYAIVEQQSGDNRWLYVALLGEGVWRLNPATGETTDTRIGAGYALSLLVHHQQLYAATTEGLFVMTSHQQWRKVCEGKFRSVCIDHEGYFWLLGDAGYEGLTLLDPQGKPTEEPYDLKHAALKGIAIDREGRVWISSSHELLMLHHGKDGLERSLFNISLDSEPLYYNYHAILIDDNERLWLGTTSGYQCLSIPRLLSQTERSDEATPLFIGAISINDEICSPGQELVLDEDVVYTRELHLRHNENNLVIECALPSGKDFSNNTYYYQLRGLSNDWRPMKDLTITLSNLPSGDYRLMVRTQSGEAVQLLAIHIAPPLWRSWWACLIYLLLTAAFIFGIVRYYNSRRTYQLKLREMTLQQEQQTQMNEMKLRFFTNISHDLRTPLSLIIGPVEELMKKQKASPSPSEGGDVEIHNTRGNPINPSNQTSPPLEGLGEALEIIHRNADHLLSLVNQILDFRRLEFGREKLVLDYGDVVSLVSDICDSFRLKGEKEHIQFTFMPSAERVETLFDRDKTTKIMMNLLSNAFKFTGEGGDVNVRLAATDSDVVISVADTGIGIPDADKPHIFDRFFQSDSASHSSIGSGIGLHIVREYVRLQGGEITVGDQPEGTGSIFRFTIPLKKASPSPSKGGDVEAHHTANNSISSGNQTSLPSEGLGEAFTLLLVDDNRDLLSYMSQALSSDYTILTAQNGVEALERLKAEDVDIIVSDVMMAEMDGLELCRRIKTNIATSHIPVVLLTAKTMSSDELQGLEAGADDYITKPFSMEILRKRIHNLVQRSQDLHQRFAKEIDIKPSEITVTSLDEQFIAKAIAIVEAHFDDMDFNVDQLSEEIGLHRSQVYKKIQHITGKTPVLFIRLLRLKRGKQLLEQSGLYVSEIAYKVGLSPRNFSKYFKEEFGLTPKEYVHSL